MGTCWYQPDGGVMPPGIYVEDEATFEALAKAPGIERVPNGWTQRVGDDPTWRPHLTFNGMTVRVATPLEAEALRALATEQREAKAKAETLVHVWAPWLKAMAGSYDAAANRMVTAERMAARQALREAARAMPRPRLRPDGHNRRARRAAAATARRA
ncbi:hypothetical protein [Methylobacterium sp. PvR107]|jgi:hypothetical protein|uniref:hypothetical protein n=1 Tax=Methylobacterium sp. PvR107 TaxID=2806597 RepID=UPI001AE534F0|nr:hypothetical protein [Methylobacterium sp. PvR107]MBP1182915.1 hypothetical protein [Methylobacterium sp. PvR107]